MAAHPVLHQEDIINLKWTEIKMMTQLVKVQDLYMYLTISIYNSISIFYNNLVSSPYKLSVLVSSPYKLLVLVSSPYKGLVSPPYNGLDPIPIQRFSLTPMKQLSFISIQSLVSSHTTA